MTSSRGSSIDLAMNAVTSAIFSPEREHVERERQ